MQIPHQLHDKRKALHLFVSFLRSAGLWEGLSAVSTGDSTVVATVYALAELAERLAAAAALRNRPHDEILEAAIERSVGRSELLENGLSSADVFYREVTGVHRAFREMVGMCEEAAHSDLGPVDVAKRIRDVNDIILVSGF